jgi:dihydrofolate reductase
MTEAATVAPRIGLVWAQAEDGVIGRDGGMPWHVPEDLAHFKAVTFGFPVVMGRSTWDSFPEKYRPLPGRRNIVITRQSGWSAAGAETAHSVAEALDLAGSESPAQIWVIGGGGVFAEVIDGADLLEVTELEHPDGFSPRPDDVRAPRIDADRFAPTAADPPSGVYTSGTGVRYRFVRYERMPAA